MCKWCREIQELFPGGVGIHHAGMLRSDRNLMEKAFADGMLKVRAAGFTALAAAVHLYLVQRWEAA